MTTEHRLRIDLAIVKEMLWKNEVLALNFVPSAYQLADCLTKKGANALRLLRVLEDGHF